MKKTRPVTLCHSKGPNLGDSINPYIFERVLGIPVKSYYKRPLRARVLGIGTIIGNRLLRPKSSLYRRCLFPLLPPLHVFSSGITGEWVSAGVAPLRPMIFHAVRGAWTRDQLIRLGLLPMEAEVALGDAGLLASFLLEKRPVKRYSCGIVPHVADYALPSVAQMHSKIKNAIVINVREEPLVVLEQMASCEMILASAMHGLILADALGIPNHWVRFSEHPQIGGRGGRFKFHDYYSIFPDYAHEPLQPEAVMTTFFPEQWMETFNPRSALVQHAQQALLKAAEKMKQALDV
jgi:pyruvyltransferase